MSCKDLSCYPTHIRLDLLLNAKKKIMHLDFFQRATTASNHSCCDGKQLWWEDLKTILIVWLCPSLVKCFSKPRKYTSLKVTSSFPVSWQDLEMLALIILRAFYAQRQILTLLYGDLIAHLYGLHIQTVYLGHVTTYILSTKYLNNASKLLVSFSIVRQKILLASASFKLC